MERESYKEVLLPLFKDSAISENQIDEVINIVLNGNNDLDKSQFDNNLEIMTDLLLESGDSCVNTNTTKLNNVDNYGDLQGAVGFNQNVPRGLCERDFNRVLNVFSDICPKFLTTFSREHHMNFEDLINELSEIDYVRRVKDPLEVWNDLKQMLPDADPIYLRNQARVLAVRPMEYYEEFLKNAIEKADYPSMQDYLIKQRELQHLAVYTKQFTLTKYLELVPNPIELFTNPERKPVLSGKEIEKSDEDFALTFLYNQFRYLRQNDIKKIFFKFKRNLTQTHHKLNFVPRAFRNQRNLIEEKECCNVNLLQEIAFLKHEKDIRHSLKVQNEKYRNALEQAKKFDLLQTCACCFDDQLIPEECLFCNNNHTFCKSCVKTGAENVIGEGGTHFPCFADCSSEFDYFVLKMVLDNKVFDRLCQKRQIEEIKSANLDGLETCPFCDFSMIPAEGDKIFKCENIECMKESCRECRHTSHVPLKCSEIEYDEDVKMRTYIENKMSEALLRTCWKCSRKFYKESGCNKMTCLCGAKMCYICGKAITDYTHFGASGCPLFTENLQQFHLTRILEGAEAAKNELGVNENPNKLKFDPTRNI